ncbi:hypothetical protein SAMD00019534_043400, partial [Acytostelium subglobosum LB1]|uniref:hypothetical protein n=1 Tax=Acytostelium subglobosum LB1 TaxID=1410327 RepID=UPI000644F5C5
MITNNERSIPHSYISMSSDDAYSSSDTTSSSSSSTSRSILSQSTGPGCGVYNVNSSPTANAPIGIGMVSPRTSSFLLKSNNAIGGISSDLSRLSMYTREADSGFGSMLSCDDETEREINTAEQLFKQLPELSYSVTKINQWGKHQKRVLRLTSRGIANVRGEYTSSLYPYADVRAIYLRDSEVFVLEYNGAAHNYVYKSTIGYQIVQEITSRLKLRRITEKKKTGFDIAMNYQHKLLSMQPPGTKHAATPAISLPVPYSGAKHHQQQQEYASGGSSSFFSMSPMSSMSRSFSFDDTESSSISSASFSSSPPPNVHLAESYDDVRIPPGMHHHQQSKRAMKLSQILGTTEEQRMHSEIDRLILGPGSVERRTIQHFISNFPYMLKQQPQTVAIQVRQFIDNTKMNILTEKQEHLRRLLVDSGEATHEDDANLSAIIERNLEKTIILRLYRPLHQAIAAQVSKDETLLRQHIEKLKGKPQEFYGIKKEFITQSNWKAAILELGGLDRCVDIPQHKLDTILASARAIYNCVNYEQRIKNKTSDDIFLSADDFLPIYIYVVVNSGVNELEFINQYLWQLCDPDKMGGEGGYYLTVFSSTLSLLRSLKMDNFETATIIDDLIQFRSSPSSKSTTNPEMITSDDEMDGPPTSPLLLPTSLSSSPPNSSLAWSSAAVPRHPHALSARGRERSISLSLNRIGLPQTTTSMLESLNEL